MDFLEKVKSLFFNLFEKREKIIFLYLIINVCWLFFGMFFHNFFRFSYRSFSISLIFLLIFNVFLILGLVGRVKFNKSFIFLILLVFFGIISTIFAKNISISLYGFWKRYEGLFQLLYYYSLMFLATNILNVKYKKGIIYFILFFGCINVFICFLQVFNVLRFIPVGTRGISYGMGLMLNTNFFGSYMILCLGLSIGLFLYSKNVSKRLDFLNFILCLIMYSGLLMSNAMSGMVGLFIICLFIVFFYVFRCIKFRSICYNFFRHVVLLFCFIVLSVFFTVSNKSLMFDDVVSFSHQTSEMVNGNVNDSYGSFRIFIWRNTLKVVPKYLLHGVGIDNFYDAFDEPLFTMNSRNYITYYDKAHNEYLEKLVCEGIFSCLTYIIMLFVIFIKSFKYIIRFDDYIVFALFFAFIGYCVQAFFNISVIHVAPLFYMVCGLLCFGRDVF